MVEILRGKTVALVVTGSIAVLCFNVMLTRGGSVRWFKVTHSAATAAGTPDAAS